MKKFIAKATAAVLGTALMLGACPAIPAMETYAATEHWNDASAESTSWKNWKEGWGKLSKNYKHVSLTPGVDETELNYGWYSQTAETPKVKISANEDMSGAKEFSGTQEKIELAGLEGYYSNKVTVEGLKENTRYLYQVYQDGEWKEIQNYTTKSFSSYSILYVGDPQIGACKGQTSTEDEKMNADKKVPMNPDEGANLAARNDAYNWNETLNAALARHPDVSFMISAGDQVNYGNNETEYAGYLGAEALRSLPVATTIGNHDSSSVQYSLHYNNPNIFEEEQYTTGRTAAGTDYYYTYGDVLFIVLDTNNYNCATHENVIAKAAAEHPEAKWRVVTFHQDIYGSGLDHSDSDGMILRTQLTPIMDEYDIDVVLQGHDHTYSRTYQLTSDGQEHTAYDKSNTDGYGEAFQNQNLCYDIKSDTVGGTVVNPEGTVYLEANSATGSKYYNLIASQQDFISERSQTWTPSYSVIDITDSTFTVTTYDVTTGQVLDGSSSYTIVKEKDKDAQTITGTASYTKTVEDQAFMLDATTDGDGKLSYRSGNEDVVMVSSKGKVMIIGEGTATITVTAAATQTRAEGIKEVRVTVTKGTRKAQAITSLTSCQKPFGTKAFNLEAKTNGDGALSYTSSDSRVAAVSRDGKVTIKNTGKTEITVTAAATEKYAKAVKTITLKVVPAKQKVTLKSTKPGRVQVKWKKDTKASGYQILCSLNRSFTKKKATVTVAAGKKYTRTLKKLVSKRKYYVKVRAYKTIDGKKCYGAYSSVKRITCK